MKLSVLIDWLDAIQTLNQDNQNFIKLLTSLAEVRKKLFAAHDTGNTNDKNEAIQAVEELLIRLQEIKDLKFKHDGTPIKLLHELKYNFFEWNEFKRSIALLDVDHTLRYEDEKHQQCINQPLLNALKKQNIFNIYFFTDMTFKNTGMPSRKQLVIDLQAQGFTVHGVITPCDYLWKHKELLTEFDNDEHLYRQKIKWDYKNDSELELIKKAKQFFCEHKKYEPLLQLNGRSLPKLGIAYDDVAQQDQVSKDIEVYSRTVKSAAELVGVAKELPIGKTLFFEHFFEKKPQWINDAILFDDKYENITSCQYAVLHYKPEIHVSAYHVRDAFHSSLARKSPHYNQKTSQYDYESAIKKHMSLKEKTIIASNYLENYKEKMLKTSIEKQSFDKFITETEQFAALEVLAEAAWLYAVRHKRIVSDEKLTFNDSDNYLQSATTINHIKKMVAMSSLQQQNYDDFIDIHINKEAKKKTPEQIAIAAMMYAKNSTLKSDDCFKKADTFIEKRQSFILILENARKRSQTSIDYFNKKSAPGRTFMDIIGFTKRNVSEKKIEALTKLITFVKDNVYDDESLEKEANKLLYTGSEKCSSPHYFSMQKTIYHEITQSRGWSKAQVLKDVQDFLNDDLKKPRYQRGIKV